MRRVAFALVGSIVWALMAGGVASADGGLVPGTTLVERWNGSAWAKVASPSPTGGDALFDVDAAGAQSAWAVGIHGKNTTSHPLIEHWNGTKWLVQTGPSTHGGSALNGVAAISPTNAWAVGRDGLGHGLVWHWNGQHWANVTDGIFDGAEFFGVDASGPGNIWVVGQRDTSTFALHSNGSLWEWVHSADRSGTNRLNAVTVIGANDVWAAGGSGLSSPQTRTLTEHYTGGAFSIVASPGGNHASLEGVASRGANDVFASGSLLNSQGCLRTLVIHWNGQQWAQQTTPNPFSCDNELHGIAASPHGVIAVGNHPQGCPGTACKGVTLVTRLVNGAWHLQASPSTAAKINVLLGASGVPGNAQFWAVGVATNSGGG